MITAAELRTARNRAVDISNNSADPEVRYLAEVVLVLFRKLTDMTDDGR